MMDKVELQIHDVVLRDWNLIGPIREEYENVISMNIHTNFSLSDQLQMVLVEVGVDFFYPENPEEIVLRGRVITGYKIKGEDVPENMAKYDVPDQLMITMLSIAISHTRALIISQAKATGLKGFIVPLANPTEIFQRMKAKAEKQSESK